jgi:hypothetical protein
MIPADKLRLGATAPFMPSGLAGSGGMGCVEGLGRISCTP